MPDGIQQYNSQFEFLLSHLVNRTGSHCFSMRNFLKYYSKPCTLLWPSQPQGEQQPGELSEVLDSNPSSGGQTSSRLFLPLRLSFIFAFPQISENPTIVFPWPLRSPCPWICSHLLVTLTYSLSSLIAGLCGIAICRTSDGVSELLSDSERLGESLLCDENVCASLVC